MIDLLVVDDHPMVLEGIRALLQGHAGMRIAGMAASSAAALQWLKEHSADIALVDINLPDQNGMELCKIIRARFPQTRVLGLSTFNERSYITRMIGAGASGYLLKNASREELEEAIETAHSGKMYMSLDVAETLISAAPPEFSVPALTQREREVLGLIAAGMTNPEIAERLFISPLTVDSHRKNLLAKFGVKNTASMIRAATEYGLLR